MLEAERQFRRTAGHRELAKLAYAVECARAAQHLKREEVTAAPVTV